MRQWAVPIQFGVEPLYRCGAADRLPGFPFGGSRQVSLRGWGEGTSLTAKVDAGRPARWVGNGLEGDIGHTKKAGSNLNSELEQGGN